MLSHLQRLGARNGRTAHAGEQNNVHQEH